MTGWITIRGKEYQIEWRDHGYEPDTNAHTIDYDIKGLPFDLTPEEEDAVWLDLEERGRTDPY